MTNERVYFNTGFFSEENKEILTKISILKYQIKKISYTAFNVKATYKSLIEEKKYKSQELQAEYLKFSNTEIWKHSKERLNLLRKMTLIKTLLSKAQIELKTINTEIKKLNREIDALRKQLQ